VVPEKAFGATERRSLKKRKVENPIGGGAPEREEPVPLFSEALKRRPEARTREWHWLKRRREGGVESPTMEEGRKTPEGKKPRRAAAGW
jgi:hypothetical protein